MLGFFIVAPSFAQNAKELPILTPGHEIIGKPYPEFRKKDKEEHRVWEWSLPFLAQRVLDKGFNLPRPYGLSLIYTHINQGLYIGDLEVSFDPNKPLKNIDFVDLEGSVVDNSTWQVKADAWLLPFLNVFALLGTVEGTGNVPININAKAFFDDIDPSICAGGPVPQFCNGNISATAPIDYHGVNYGIGFLLAAAANNFFFAMPVTYVETDVNVSTSNSISLNIIPRVGYNIQTEKSGKFGLYVAANYLDSHVDLTGTYTLPMASSPIGRDVEVEYKLREHVLDKWNAVLGVNWELSEFWSADLELGFSENRDMQTFLFNYRF